MNSRLVGAFGSFGLIDGGRGREMSVNLETATQFFRKSFVEKGSPLSDPVGLFSQLDVGADGKAKLIQIGTPRHVLQPLTNCTTWNPKGSINLTPGEIGTAAVEFMGTQCSDAFVGECFEKLLPLGSDIWDFTATPEGRGLFNVMLAGVYSALGNSIHDLVFFGKHPLITDADTSTWYNTDKVTTEEWEDFIEQMTLIDMKGIYTLIDELKAASTPGYTVDISSYYTGTGAFDTTKDVTALFDLVLGEATGELNVALERMRGQIDVAIIVDGTTFRAYKKYIIANYGAIPQGFEFLMEGEAQRGVLMYDGKPVIVDDSIGMMDAYLGVNQRRVMVTALGNWAIARQQVALPSEFDGAGLMIEQSPRLRDKKRVDMNAVFRLNTAITDTDFMVSGEHTVTP